MMTFTLTVLLLLVTLLASLYVGTRRNVEDLREKLAAAHKRCDDIILMHQQMVAANQPGSVAIPQEIDCEALSDEEVENLRRNTEDLTDGERLALHARFSAVIRDTYPIPHTRDITEEA